MSNYDYYKNTLKKILNNISEPLQLEIQPGTGCEGYNCKFCYGFDKKQNIGWELSIDRYIKLLDDIKDKTKLVQLAGIKSDPLTYSDIKKLIYNIKIKGFNIGVHTKGYLLTPEIAYLLNINSKEGDFITFSIDSSNNTIYNELHGLPKHSAYLLYVKENIKTLYRLKKLSNSRLNINIACLLFKQNSSYNQMDDFIDQYKYCCDVIKFSFPQVPNDMEKIPYYFIKNNQFCKEREEIIKNIESLKIKHSNIKIVFLDFENDKHETKFQKCYAQKLLFTVDRIGNVYPCPQVTTQGYNHLIYGNLKEQSFKEIWNSNKRKNILNMSVDDMKCRICDRKDECLNIKFNEELK